MDNLNEHPFNSLSGFDQIARLTNFITQAYFRRSRQLPANLSQMAECLRGDILKNMPRVPVETVDMAITTATLEEDKPLSVAFFYSAIRNRYGGRVNGHSWDHDEHTRPDTEEDYLALMDTLAAFIDQRPIFFNAWREYANLVKRGQLDRDAWRHNVDKAIAKINRDRAADGQLRKLNLSPEDENVQATAMRLAVEDWLRSCKTMNTTPSKRLKR